MTYDEILNDNHGIFHKLRLTMDGKVLDDYPENVEFNNMANDSSGIEVGTAYASSLTLEIRNVSAEILNQEVFVEDGARDPDGNFVCKPLGYFMAVSSSHDRGITKYTLYDRMAYKLAGQYVTSLTFPATDKAVIEEMCTRCGVKLIGTLTAHTIDTAPSGTNKEVLAYMLQLQGKNAVFNENGDLELKWYEDKGYTIDDSQIYMEGDASTTAAFTIGYIKNTRSVKKTETKYEEQTEYDDDGNASVKNVPYTEESTEEQTYVAGDGLQGIVFANPYMTQAIVNELYEKLKNFSYTPATFHFVGDYRVRAMDIVTVTTDGGKEYKVPVMAIDHSCDGGLASTVYSYGVSESSGSMDSGSSNSRAMERYDADLAYLKAVYANTMNAERAKILFLQTKELQAEVGKFGYVKTDKLEAAVADLGYVKSKDLESENGKFGYLKAQDFEGENARFKYAEAEEMKVVKEDVEHLTSDYGEFVKATAEQFEADDARIKKLDADKLSSTDADLKYANIDFSNIGKAAMEYFYAQSGLIKDVTIDGATITGEIVGVTFRGDLIIGNTIIADKLVIKGEDGLYYKLNTDGVTTEKEQSDYNSLNGQIIRAKSVTAEKVAVDDLVAFGATIGGFHITLHSIFSGVKESATNTTRGIFMGDDGQFAFGDGSDYVKYYRDQNGTYKLAISASEITISSGKNLADAVDDLEKKMDDVRYVTDTEVRYQAGASGTTPPTGTWQISVPVVPTGQYLWTRTTTKYNFGDDVVSYSVGATGSKGEKGDPGGTGDAGNGISSIIEYYAVSSSNTTAPISWVTTPLQMTDVNKYLWSYRVYSYTNGTTTETRKCVIGVYGDSGTVGAGGNLVKNGFGEYLDNTNFSDGGGIFTRGDCPEGCYGYFTNGETGYMPFDPTKVYDLEFWIRAGKAATADSRNYFSIIPYDVDGNPIAYYHVTNYTRDLFYLSEDLNPGDTVVHFTDLSKWHTSTSAAYQRSMLFFGYTDNTGYTYPDGTYSRYAYLNVYASDSSVDKTNNTILLSKAWTGRAYKKGTCATQTTDGATYCYYGQAGSIYGVNEWSKRKAQVFAGTKENPANRRLLYTKKIKIFLYNHTADYAGISLKEQTGVGIVKTEVTYAVSASGTTAPTSGWQTNPPTAVADQYMWTRTVYTYTDSTTSTSYSVAKNGADGSAGKDGSKTVIAKVSYSGNDYYANYSEATISYKIANSISDNFSVSSSDNISIGDIALCKCIASDTKRVTYMMLKVTSKSSTTINGTVIGQTNGVNGTSPTVSDTKIEYQQSTSGTTTPTGTWSTTPPTAIAGQYMWTRTTVTYSDGKTAVSYAVGKNGTNGSAGAAGRGIKSTAVTYQAGGSGTTVPTGTWVSSPPATTADKPYMWTRTVYTYTDSTTSTSYSVGATPEGIEVGGKNLWIETAYDKSTYTLGSKTKIGWYASPTKTLVTDDIGDKAQKMSLTDWSCGQYVSVKKGQKYTFSCDVKLDSTASVNEYTFYLRPDVLNISSLAFPDKITKEWKRIAYTYTAVSDGIERFHLRGDASNSSSFLIKHIKMEKGNKATDWTPAPEDVDSAIDSAQNTADGAQNSANAAQSTANNAQSTANDAKKKIEFIVASGSSASSITLTDAAIAAITKQFKITGSDGSTTIIEGGKIKVNDLTALSAKIGGWELGTGYIRDKDSSNRYSGIGRNGVTYAFFAGGTKADGSDGKFRVGHDGALTATNATISGAITATSFLYSQKIGSNTAFFEVANGELSTGYKDSNGTFFGGLSVTGEETTITGRNVDIQSNMEGSECCILMQDFMTLQSDGEISIGGSSCYISSALTTTGDITTTGGYVYAPRVVLGNGYISNGPNDSAFSPGQPLNNLVISSWWGISFTNGCGGQKYSDKTAVSIDCRSGRLCAGENIYANGGMEVRSGWFDLSINGVNYGNIYVNAGGNNLSLRSNTGQIDLLASNQICCVNSSWSAWVQIKAKQFNVQSSIRYKTNVQNMTEERARLLLDMRPVSYDYAVMGCEKDQLGLIAEEVDEIDHYAVAYDEYHRPDSLDYSRFVPQLIKLCQLQQKEIDNLKTELSKLKA